MSEIIIVILAIAVLTAVILFIDGLYQRQLTRGQTLSEMQWLRRKTKKNRKLLKTWLIDTVNKSKTMAATMNERESMVNKQAKSGRNYQHRREFTEYPSIQGDSI